MAVISPLETVDLAGFIDGLRDKGFSAPEAMKVYDELRLFGHGACRKEPVDADDALWDSIRTKACDRLLKMKSPEDFSSYLRGFAELDPALDKPQIFLNAWVGSKNKQRIDREEIILRASTSIVHLGLERWNNWDEIGLEWEDVKAAVDLDRCAVPDADAAAPGIQEAVDEAALAWVEWTAVDASRPGITNDLGSQIHQANIALQARTGWTGGVFGLAGHCRLSIGGCRSGVTGSCSTLARGEYCIDTSATHPWGCVAHEWLHGLDYLCGSTQTKTDWDAATTMSQQVPASASRPGRSVPHEWLHALDRVPDTTQTNANDNAASAAITCWKQLLEDFSSFDPNARAETRKLIEIELNEGFERRWTNDTIDTPVGELMIQVRDERAAGAIDEVSRASQIARLCAVYEQTYKPEIRAELAMTELEMLTQQSQILKGGGSVWVQFLGRVCENITTRLPGDAEDWGDYFNDPMEKVAHSFESSFGAQDSFITDVRPELTSLRYPLPSESRSQEGAWNKLFRGLDGWWSEHGLAPALADVLQAHTPEKLFGGRLTTRREAANQEDLPLAARLGI